MYSRKEKKKIIIVGINDGLYSIFDVNITHLKLSIVEIMQHIHKGFFCNQMVGAYDDSMFYLYDSNNT